MNLQTIAEHTVAMDLLPEKANILDLGCRGFEFTDYFRNLGHNVIAVDLDDLPRDDYHKVALSNYDGLCDKQVTNDPNATRIRDGFGIRCTTLHNFCKWDDIRIPFWNLIKLDIESSEYEVIMSMDRPYATQISWEAHLHTGAYGEREMREMEDKLVSLGYVPVSHEMSSRHGAGLNFWDSLWIWFENKRIK